MTTRARQTVLTAFVFLVFGPITASPLTFTFSGTITHVNSGAGTSAAIQVGDSFVGTLSYELDWAVQWPGTLGAYVIQNGFPSSQTRVSSVLSIQVDNRSEEWVTDPWLAQQIIVSDGATADSAYVRGEGLGGTALSMELWDPSGLALHDHSLPFEWNLQDWAKGEIYLGYLPGVSSAWFQGTISGTRVVPVTDEVGTLLLMILGLAGLVSVKILVAEYRPSAKSGPPQI